MTITAEYIAEAVGNFFLQEKVWHILRRIGVQTLGSHLQKGQKLNNPNIQIFLEESHGDP
jgi:hypothetical protein